MSGRVWRVISVAAISAAAIAVAGCISVGSNSGAKQQATASIYTLHAGDAGPNRAVRTSAAGIAVTPPELPEGFATDRIALYFENGQRFDYFAHAQWSGPLAAVLQQSIIGAARRQWPGRLVDVPDLATAARYSLAVRVADFEPVYEAQPDAPPQLKVGVTMTLLALPAHVAKAQVTVSQTVAASANTLTAVTKGLDDLLRQVLDEAMQKLAAEMPSA